MTDPYEGLATYPVELGACGTCGYCMVECADRYNRGCWMTAQQAYDMLCPGNPAGVPGGREEHRALSDAVLEGYILLGLCGRDPDIRGRYVRAAEGSE